MPVPSSRRARLSLILAVVSLALVAAVTYPHATTADNSILLSAGENLEGYDTPEAAALDMFRACTRRSPQLFIQSRMLGVCDGPVDTLNKYAEALHTTKYKSGADELTVYDLPKLMKKETEHVVASQSFSETQVGALSGQFLSTYYCEKLISCVEVEAEYSDGRMFRTRLVVAQINGRWYAMPRCRSSRSFYEIADTLPLTESAAK